MRILLVGPYALDRQYSIPAFVSALKTGLCDLNQQVKTCAPQESRGGRALKPLLRRRSAFYDKFVAFLPELRRKAKNADVVLIAEHGYAIYQKSLRNKPHVVVCHDLIVAKAALGEINDWPLTIPAKRYQFSILKHLRAADRVVCASECTRQDVLRLTNRPLEKTPLIYDGFVRQMPRMSEAESAEVLQNTGIPLDSDWFMHIGGNQPNKNKIGVAKIYAELQKHAATRSLGLVMAGAMPSDEVREVLANVHDPSKAHFLNLPSDEQVRALYSRARALLFPSSYEGFGLPIIEAQSAGCPVITTNRPPMTEVAGDAAILIDPTNPVQAAKEIAAQMANLTEFIPKGLANIERFSTDLMAKNYLEVFKEMV